MQKKDSVQEAQFYRNEAQNINSLLSSVDNSEAILPAVVEWEVKGTETIELIEVEEVFDVYDHLIVEEPGMQLSEYIEEGIHLSVLFFQSVGHILIQAIIIGVKIIGYVITGLFYLLVELVSQLSMPSVSHHDKPVRKKKSRSVTIINNISVSSKADVTIKNNIHVK